jgi:hypothetical protein
MSRGTPVLAELEDGESHEFIVVPQMRAPSLADLLAEYGYLDISHMDEERFQIIEPGQRLVHSSDERIMRVATDAG